MSDAALRQQVRERAARRCEYCRLPDWLPPLEPFHLEHIVARQHGGVTEVGNLASGADGTGGPVRTVGQHNKMSESGMKCFRQ